MFVCGSRIQTAYGSHSYVPLWYLHLALLTHHSITFHPCQAPGYHNLEKFWIINHRWQWQLLIAESYFLFFFCSKRATLNHRLSLHCGTPRLIEGHKRQSVYSRILNFSYLPYPYWAHRSVTPGDWGNTLTTLLAVIYKCWPFARLGNDSPLLPQLTSLCQFLKNLPFFKSLYCHLQERCLMKLQVSDGYEGSMNMPWGCVGHCPRWP